MGKKELLNADTVIFKDGTTGKVKKVNANTVVLTNGLTCAKTFIKTWY